MELKGGKGQPRLCLSLIESVQPSYTKEERNVHVDSLEVQAGRMDAYK